MEEIVPGVVIDGEITDESGKILTADALNFVARMHREFDQTRMRLLDDRKTRFEDLQKGILPRFLEQTAGIRSEDWKVASTPDDLQRRWVEITGPVDRKMMINALNSGANVFMADFEDSLSPTWKNVVQGQINLMDAVRRTISLSTPEGKSYSLKDEIATLLVRPRGWHLVERNVLVDGQPISAGLFDFGLYFFHNAKELLKRGTGPYFYLAKLESHLEARLWNQAFEFAEKEVGVPVGTIRATVLVETILAAFEMEEILYELRNHSSGLNAGRWDYIFSLIKKLGNQSNRVLPDRAQVVMTVPFMRAYTELLVKTCHRRGAHAIGGMAAFVPSRKNPEINEVALARVREDKEREAGDGFDGTWIAHPDLVEVAKEEFRKVLNEKPHQKERLREDVVAAPDALVSLEVPGGTVTEKGVQNNVSVVIQYLESWLRGVGAVTIFNLMEDTATAEIARAQLWQWIKLGTRLEDGREVTLSLYEKIRDEEISKLDSQNQGRYSKAAEILDSLVMSESFVEFLTLPAYQLLS